MLRKLEQKKSDKQQNVSNLLEIQFSFFDDEEKVRLSWTNAHLYVILYSESYLFFIIVMILIISSILLIEFRFNLISIQLFKNIAIFLYGTMMMIMMKWCHFFFARRKWWNSFFSLSFWSQPPPPPPPPSTLIFYLFSIEKEKEFENSTKKKNK